MYLIFISNKNSINDEVEVKHGPFILNTFKFNRFGVGVIASVPYIRNGNLYLLSLLIRWDFVKKYNHIQLYGAFNIILPVGSNTLPYPSR